MSSALVSPPRDKKATDPGLVAVAAGADGPDAARAAFRTLYERYADDVFAFLRRFLGDATLAEDALQETFLRVHARLPEHDPERSFRGWVYRIARNAAIDLVRRQEKQGRLAGAQAERLAPPEPEQVVAQAARRERIDQARDALAALDEDDRMLLLLYHGQGLTQVELAEVFACTERTIRNRLGRALDALADAVLEGGAA